MNNIKYLLLFEGSAEQAICDLLMQKQLLHFTESELLFGKGINKLTYDGIKQYLSYSFRTDGINEIRIYRIKDRKHVPFKIGKIHRDLIRGPVDILTTPEIEILYIISQGKYQDYLKVKDRNKVKPSDYVKDCLRCKEIKHYDYVYSHFSETGLLLRSIADYHRYTTNNVTIWNILKENFDEKKLWRS